MNYKIPEVLAGGPLGLIDFVLQAFVVPHVVVFEKYFKKRSTSDFFVTDGRGALVPWCRRNCVLVLG